MAHLFIIEDVGLSTFKHIYSLNMFKDSNFVIIGGRMNQPVMSVIS